MSRAVEPRTPPLSDYFAGLPQPPWEPDAADTQPAAWIARVIGRAEAARATVSTIVARCLGCFQGDGELVQAIDLRRTKSAWRQPLSEAGTLLISMQLGDFKTAADEMFNASRVEGLLKRYTAATTHVLPTICERLSDWDGAGPATQLLEQLQQAQKAGLFALITSGSFEQSKRAVETLSGEEARQLIRQALAFKEPDPQSLIESRLLAWSALNMRQLVAVSDALVLLDRVLPDLDRAADSQLSTLGGADISAMLTGLQTDLEAITKEFGQ